MKLYFKLAIVAVSFIVFSCEYIDDFSGGGGSSSGDNINFSYQSTIQVGGEGASEISAFDSRTNKLFVVNVEINEISVFDITDIHAPVKLSSIKVSGMGFPNSVAVAKGKLAVALEAPVQTDSGHILIFDTDTQSQIGSYQVGALPDMVTFSPNGEYIVSANEGQPSDDYLIDPKGSVSIINVKKATVSTLEFDAFNGQEPIWSQRVLGFLGQTLLWRWM